MILHWILLGLGVVVAILLVITGIISSYENKQLTTETYKIQSPKIPESFDGFRIVFLTDLHGVVFGDKNQHLIEAIDNCKPDLVLVGGDMIVRGIPHYGHVVDLMEELASKYTVYYADGNHELKWKREEEEYGILYKDYTHDLKEAGVIHISNETVVMEKDGEYLFLVAMDLDKKFYNKGKVYKMTAEDVTRAVGKEPKQGFRIFLAHNPNYFENYARWGGDLVLSGHFHGGIIRLPGLGGVISPQFQLFPKYHSGTYTYKDSTMILSRGLGNHSIKVRVNNRPEVSLITLEKQRIEDDH